MPSPLIFGCSSLSLTEEERDFFTNVKPLGVIIFSRNCKSPTQIRMLIDEINNCLDERAWILIDQEGGRVNRLHDNAPPASSFKDANTVYDHARSVAKNLKSLGITINCAPCCDLLIEGADGIIGDRSFSNDPSVVCDLAFAVVKGFIDEGITPVLKHMPGHGRAPLDSHEFLPVVKESLDVLKESDFLVFKTLCDRIKDHHIKMPLGMSAHVLFESIDQSYPATHSSKVISKIIRDFIGFNGLLLSDCLTMKALSGPFSTRAYSAFKAGCDVVLHCNGHLDEMEDVVLGYHKFINL